ncbi:MAG: nitrate reductase [Acidobacteriota bacterium]|nr:nitrate reductase [Acidobacteriota bacterium]
MSFRSVFIAVFLGTAILVAAFLVSRARPREESSQPTGALVRASGKCAECHARETPAIVHEYERSRHAAKSLNCLECHQPLAGQEKVDHRGFVIAKKLTSANCRQCHASQYDQFQRSRHAAPSWAAVAGSKDFTPEQVAFAEKYHPGWVNRPANALAQLEGPNAIESGCLKCHAVGQPNADGSIGTCTNCHARHAASVELARLPETCGQCHLGPDHSQIEIYHESKHGVLFNAQRASMRLSAPAKELTTRDMPVPTCATCHMSGLEGQKVTHDTTERLSYFLFAAVSDKRPGYLSGQTAMKETCRKCHTTGPIDRYYQQAEGVVAATNQSVLAAKTIMDRLYAEGKLTKAPFDEPIEYLYFDMWHYDGRTAKHGAFMGGADFVQWHGAYQLTAKLIELQAAAAEIDARGKAAPGSRAVAR